MTDLTVIPGQREELERKLVELIFTPGDTPPEFKAILAKLEQRGDLNLVGSPDGITPNGQ